MSPITKAVAAYIALHSFTIALTIFRLGQRIFVYFFWADDFVVGLSTFGNILMLERLVSFALHRRRYEPVQFRVELFTYFCVVWLSRASMMLASARIHMESPRRVRHSSIIAALCVAVGTLYGTLAMTLCTNNWGCADTDTCLCYPPQSLMVSSLIVDVLIDTAFVIFNWRLLVQLPGLKFRTVSLRRRLVIIGFCSNIFVLFTGIICFIIYATHYKKDRLLLFYYINTHMIIASLSANLSVTLGVISRILGLKDPQPMILHLVHVPRSTPDNTTHTHHMLAGQVEKGPELDDITIESQKITKDRLRG